MCKVTSKALMGIMTVIFWGAAAGLIFIGAWVFKEYQHYDHMVKAYYTLIPAAILIGVGIFFFILGLIGCVGAFKENRCLLASFFSILLIILIGQIVAAALGYVYRNDIETAVEDGIQHGLDNYNNDTILKQEVDFMQRELHCCGAYNYTDWEDTPWGKSHKDRHVLVPDSCCPDNNCSFVFVQNGTTGNPVSTYYAQGCYLKMKDQFLRHIGIVIGVGAGFGILLIFGMIAACGIFCRRHPANTYIGLTSPEHMRV